MKQGGAEVKEAKQLKGHICPFLFGENRVVAERCHYTTREEKGSGRGTISC
jgi:hypothetical protein